MKTKKKPTCTPEQFIEAWQTSKTVAEVGQKLGISKQAASARATAYKRMGIKVKNYRVSLDSLDVNKLNELVEKFNQDQVLNEGKK